MTDNDVALWGIVAFFSLVAFAILVFSIREVLVAKYTGKKPSNTE
jgi:hypothetical protein